METRSPFPPARVELRDAQAARKHLRIALTKSCELRCFFCHAEGGEVSHYQQLPSAFSPETLGRIVELAAEVGIRKIKLTGGEPLQYRYEDSELHDAVRAMTRAAAPHGVEISLVSNGTRLTYDCARALKAAGLARFSLSLHSATPEGFQRYAAPRDTGAFSNAIRSLDVANECGLTPVKINSVIYFSRTDSTLRNTDEIPRLLEIAQNHNVAEIRFFVVVQNPRLPAKVHKDTYVFWDDDVFHGLIPDGIRASLAQHIRDRSLGQKAFPGSYRVSFQANAGSAAPRLSFHSLRIRRSVHLPGHPCDGTCHEGAYAIRLLPNGLLKACLWDSAERDLLRALGTADTAACIDLLKEGLDSIHIPAELAAHADALVA